MYQQVRRTSSIGDVLQLNQSCHRSTVRSNFSSYLWTCVIVSSWSTLGTIKPDLLGVNLLIRHRFILSENESVPQMILMHFLLLSAQTDELFHLQVTETEEVSQFPSD
ncbi:hypothetical protein AMECASPLE_010957 [Ameca splendens]|uniref:Uncharacterized protein n=1 Tax=Ameca splendens TaxID=208324 RepID=A0ABV0Y0R8_9TELE